MKSTGIIWNYLAELDSGNGSSANSFKGMRILAGLTPFQHKDHDLSRDELGVSVSNMNLADEQRRLSWTDIWMMANRRP